MTRAIAVETSPGGFCRRVPYNELLSPATKGEWTPAITTHRGMALTPHLQLRSHVRRSPDMTTARRLSARMLENDIREGMCVGPHPRSEVGDQSLSRFPLLGAR